MILSGRESYHFVASTGAPGTSWPKVARRSANWDAATTVTT